MARVAAVGKYYFPYEGGIEVNTRDVCEFLARDHNVTALVHAHAGAAGPEILRGVSVLRCPTLAVVRGQPISLSLVWRIFRSRADVFHLHAPNFVAAAALLARIALSRSPPGVVITHHADVQGRPLLRALAVPVYKMLARRAALVIVTSEKNAAISRDLPKGARVRAVPLGIDPADYSLSAEEVAAGQAWRRSVAGGAPVVCFVGRHARYKGLHVLVRALAALPGVHALIAGDGPFRSTAQDLAREIGVADRAHFLGQVDHRTKLKVLSCADVFAFPSTEITEAFGVAQLEAMAMKVPVVATDLPTGVTDVAVHGRTAHVVTPGDSDALAAGIGLVLADRAYARRLAEEAWTAIVTKYSREKTAARAAQAVISALPPSRPDAPGVPLRRAE